ncbi:glycosyl transferase family, a/b domain-containing protein [Lipomyces orientalis]|uniref:Glycosyl transferase family, a/b domain-containing protein n=1 Tax=Lipomyces orientalis TaxID=1233043 RepID=A0ACC3TQU5_9ASCO
MVSPLTPYLRALTDSQATLSEADLRLCFHIMFTTDVPQVQSAAFLTTLRTHGFDRDPRIIAAAVEAMREFALTVDVPGNNYIDVVGTGGDGKNTFNVSTTAGLVTAGMGLRICKHGNRASTSSSGAADVLMSLGASIQSVTPFTVAQVLNESPFCFLFAPVYHPILGKIGPIRKGLGFPTIFNVLGPLLNPAPISARVIGVNAPELGEIFAKTIILLDQKAGRTSSCMIVWGEEGLDEISPAGPTRTWRVYPGSDEVVEGMIEPEDFGLHRHELDTVASGTPHENSEMVRKLVNNELEECHPILDYVLMNAAALVVVSGKTDSWKQGVELARESIASGGAKKALQDFVNATTKAKSSIEASTQ